MSGHENGGQSVEKDAPSWPARAYTYGTWRYALARAREHAQERHQRVYLYRGDLDGEAVWVAAWDPKPTRVIPPATTAPREDA